MTRQIARVKPYLMGDHLILAFDSKWIEVFGTIPTFTVTIEKDVLTIKSLEIVEIKENQQKFSLSEDSLGEA